MGFIGDFVVAATINAHRRAQRRFLRRPFPVGAVPHDVTAVDFSDGGVKQATGFPRLIDFQHRIDVDLPVSSVATNRVSDAPAFRRNIGVPETVLVAVVDDRGGVHVAEQRLRRRRPREAVLARRIVQGVQCGGIMKVGGREPHPQFAVAHWNAVICASNVGVSIERLPSENCNTGPDACF